MAIIAKPIESYTMKSGDFPLGWAPKHTLYTLEETFVKRAMVDSDYIYKALNGLPLFELPYTYIKTTYHKPKIWYMNRYWTNIDSWGGFNPKMNFKSLEAQATLNLFKDVDKDRVANLGTSLAELRETIGFIGSTAFKLANAYRSLRKGDIKSAARSLGVLDRHNIRHLRFPSGKRHKTGKALRIYLERRRRHENHYDFLASSWMEYSYAWKPLIYDTYDMAKAAAFANVQPHYDLSYIGYAKENLQNIHFSADSSGNMETVSVSGFHCVKIKNNFKVWNPGLRNLNILGLSNPAVVAWEVVPFSFVVDWFYPVGDYLQNFSAFDGLSFVDGMKTYYFNGTGVCKKAPNAPWTISSNATASTNHIYMVRKKTTAPVRNAPPTFDLMNALGVNHALTSLSLLQLLRPKK